MGKGAVGQEGFEVDCEAVDQFVRGRGREGEGEGVREESGGLVGVYGQVVGVYWG